MKNILTIALLFLALSASAVDRIKATLTVTNAAVTGDTLTITSGSVTTRTFTNATTATTITTNGTAGGTATNAFLALAQYTPPGALALEYVSSNAFSLTAPSGAPLMVAFSAGVGTVSYSTQLVSSMLAVRVPVSAEPSEAVRTNIGTGVLDALAYSTNTAGQTITALAGYASLHQSQTLSNKTLRTARLESPVISSGVITNIVELSGTLGRLTNGALEATLIDTATLTNSTSATKFYASGTGGGLALHVAGTDSGNRAIAIGYEPNSLGAYDIAIGDAATASGGDSISLTIQGTSSGSKSFSAGWSPQALGTGSISIGQSAYTDDSNAIAIGSFADVGYANGGAFGPNATCEEDGQLMLGDSDMDKVAVYGSMRIGSNLGVGATMLTFPASMVGGIYLTNGTAASADPASGAALWSVGGSVQYRTSGASEGSGITAQMHNRAAEVIGSGSDYSLTTTYAFVNFGGTDPEFNTLPTAGTYLVTALVAFNDGATVNDEFYFKLYNATAAADIANSETHLEGVGGTHHMQCVVQSVLTITTPSRIQLYGRNATAARGNVESIHTKLTYVRLY